MIEGLAKMDPFWVGATGNRGVALLTAIAKAIALDDEIREDEDTEFTEYLVEDSDLAKVGAAGKALLGGPAAASIRAALGSLEQKLQAALAKAGFSA
jgi:hypothetical protein